MLSSKSKQATARREPINDMASISSSTYRYGSGDKTIDTQLEVFPTAFAFYAAGREKEVPVGCSPCADQCV